MSSPETLNRYNDLLGEYLSAARNALVFSGQRDEAVSYARAMEKALGIGPDGGPSTITRGGQTYEIPKRPEWMDDE